MAILKRLESFLKKNKAAFKSIEHKTVYTTFDASQTLHCDPKMIAKALLVQAGADYVFAVIPGHRQLDTVKLKSVINQKRKKEGLPLAKRVKIASENQIKRNVTKKVGALVPFGSLYKKETFADRLLLRNKKIILNGGSFEDSIEMTTPAYQKVENPILGTISKTRKK